MLDAEQHDPQINPYEPPRVPCRDIDKPETKGRVRLCGVKNIGNVRVQLPEGRVVVTRVVQAEVGQPLVLENLSQKFFSSMIVSITPRLSTGVDEPSEINAYEVGLEDKRWRGVRKDQPIPWMKVPRLLWEMVKRDIMELLQPPPVAQCKCVILPSPNQVQQLERAYCLEQNDPSGVLLVAYNINLKMRDLLRRRSKNRQRKV